MRGLVVVLLVVNILLLAWWWLQPRPVPLQPALGLAASPLLLATEVPAAESPVPEDVAPSVVAEGPEPGCHALGPYPDRDVAMSVRQQLSDVGVAATPRSEDASQRLGYWVHTPQAPDRASADTMVERLRRAGIRDFYVVADGEFANVVSLGVFSQIDGAERHAQRMRGMGFEVVVGERLRRSTAWWLDFPTPEPGSEGSVRVIGLALAGGETVAVLPRPCE